MNPRGSRSGPPPATYYRSMHLSPPIIYVQERDTWLSLRTDGTQLGRGIGLLSPQILQWVQEIDQAQANQLVSGGLRQPTPLEGDESGEDELDDQVEDYAQDAGAEFKPVLWRYIAGKAIRMGAAFTVTALLLWEYLPTTGYGPHPDDPLRPLMVAFFGSLTTCLLIKAYYDYRASPERFVVRVTDSAVSGPQQWWWGQGSGGSRQTILLTHLDRARSSTRGVIDRFLGRHYLYSVTGDRIYLQRWAFAGTDIRRLLNALGLAGNP